MWTWTEAPFKVASAAMGTLMVLVGGTYKSVSFVEDRYAHQDDVALIEMRLNEKIESDRLNQVQQRVWRLEDRYGADRAKWPDYAVEEVRQLEQVKQSLERRLQLLDNHLLQQRAVPERAQEGR